VSGRFIDEAPTLRPYEKIKVSTQLVFDLWMERSKQLLDDFSVKSKKD
jgi:hypothetical protein